MSGQIFISYRREDSSAWAGRLSDRLKNRLPSSEVFMDVDTMEPGVDFVEAVEEVVTACDVLIAVIGSRWLTSSSRGVRRLDIPEDLVRLEIATALKRGIRVVPVLVEGATMPEAGELPDDLKALVRRNALEIGHNRFDADSEHLVNAVGRVLQKAREKREEKERQETERLQKEEQGRLRIEPPAQVPSPIVPDAPSTPSAQPEADKPSAGNPQTVYPRQPRPAEAKPENPPPPFPGETGGKSPSKQLIAVVVIAAVVLASGLIYLATRQSNSRTTQPAPGTAATQNLPAVSTPVPASLRPAQAAERHLTILAAIPDLAFPYFAHMADQIKDESTKIGDIDLIVADGQRSSPKQTADVEAAITKGVDGMLVDPINVDALAPAIQEAVGAKIPVVTVGRRVYKVPGILAHVGADNVKGGEAQGKLIEKLFPNGATIMNLQGQSGSSPAIDRNKGLHNVIDQAKDKYKIVFEDTAGFDRSKGLAMTESALAGMATPPDVIVAANDDMALGALEALKARNLLGKVKLIGFDALPEALGQIKAGNMTATIEQLPGGQVREALQTLVAFLRDGKKPDQQVILFTPIAITSENLNQAGRLNEVK